MQNAEMFLKSYRLNMASVQNLTDEIKYIQNEIEKMQDQPGDWREIKDMHWRLRYKLNQYMETHKATIKSLQENCKRVEDAIDGLPDPAQRQVIQMRYIDGWKWDQIAQAMYYTTQTIHRKHKQALEVLEEMIDTTGAK